MLLVGAASFATQRSAVSADRLVAAAQAALQARADDAHVDAHFAVVGKVDDLALPLQGPAVLHAHVQDAWLRARIGVPVQVTLGDRPVSTVLVWFAVTAPTQALVYGTDYPRGTPASTVHVHAGTVDLARSHGASSMQAMDSVSGQRLQRAVSAGEAVIAADFEPSPDVQAQQQVRIEATSGVVHLTTLGQALADGRIGQTIAVLPAGASQPVRARVVSNQEVSIEH